MRPRRTAILGASGFIGLRAVEMMHFEEWTQVRPIVRAVPSMARLSRFALPTALADARDERALTEAFTGCDALVHSVTGSAPLIEGCVEPCYRAAVRAGVRKIVYLSTSVVHGQNPEPGTTESAPLSDRQAIEYNNAKVRAERRWTELGHTGPVEIVTLRPGIVYGPRDRWIAPFADLVLAGTAYWVNGGAGYLNGIYVDNLIHAIRLALSTDGLHGKVYFVNDREPVTWADFYGRIAAALGASRGAVRTVLPRADRRTPAETAHSVITSKVLKPVLPYVPRRWKRAVKQGLGAFLEEDPKSVWSRGSQPSVTPTLEMSLLHCCRWRYRDDRARSEMGYEPLVPHEEAMRRSLGWLASIGYPVVKS